MPPRRAAVAAFAALLAGCLAFTAGSPSAAAQPDPRIVGGDPVPPGQFAWTAALVEAGYSRKSGFRCGAAVVAHSWVLTAAHCLVDGNDLYPDSRYGIFVGPDFYDVVTGTTSLVDESQGQRLPVAAVWVSPHYDPATGDGDLALLRLGRPTAAPSLAVIGTSSAEQALDDAGAVATVTGWGRTAYGTGGAQNDLRSVQVTVQSDATCSTAYPPGFTDDSGEPLEYHAASMLCAGPLEGGKDACQGDSGGPLAVQAPDTSWREIGIVSTGYKCAEPGYPGIYTRLAPESGWIGHTQRLGPFDPNGFAFVAQQYRDFVGTDPSDERMAQWLQALSDNDPADIIALFAASAPWQDSAGTVARLYSAAFARNPDTAGLDYWVRRRWAGRGPVSIANHFVVSPEFDRRFGDLGTQDFITLLYRHVFDRDPDSGGRDYWTRKLASGVGRGQMLYELSNSGEYRRRTDTTVRIITTRFGLLRVVPTAGELAASEALDQHDLIDLLRTSYRYASRFGG